MQAWQATVQDDNGNIIPLPFVSIYNEDGVTLAAIFDADGNAIANPITGDIDGFVQFYAGPGHYKVDAVGVTPWDVALGGVYTSYAAVLAADKGGQDAVSAYVGGHEVRWLRESGGPCLGGGWVPSGEVWPHHFGTSAGGWQGAINSAIEWVSAGGGGRVVLPALAAPYEISSPIIVRSKVEVDFGKATIRLASGANCDILQTENFYALTGSNNYAVNGSPNGFTLTGGIFDGNWINQGPSDPDACNGLAVYGYGFTLKDMEFRNIRGNGYRGEWGQFGGESVGHSMESTIENVRFDTSGRRGFWHKGPHDANISHIIVVDASQEADDTYDGILNEGYGGARWYNPHVWHRSAATNRARWAGNFAGGGNEILGGHFEGCRRQYRTTGNNQAFGVQLYAPRSDNAQIEISGERNILFGRFANSTQNRRPVVLSLGDTATAGLSNIELVAGVGAGTTNPVVRVVASVGNNKIRVQATGAVTPSTFFAGAFDDYDEVHLHQEFPARVAYRKIPFIASGAPPDPAAPGQYHFYTPSSGTARPIWRNGANTAWVDANGAIVSIA